MSVVLRQMRVRPKIALPLTVSVGPSRFARPQISNELAVYKERPFTARSPRRSAVFWCRVSLCNYKQRRRKVVLLWGLFCTFQASPAQTKSAS